MAENQLESNQPGDQELPTPEFSESGVSSTSTGADEIVSKLTPILEQIVERKVQSVKDKRFSEIEKALGGRAKLLAELEGAGVSIPKEVQSELRLRELEERIAQTSTQPAQVSDAGPSQQKAAVTEAIAELKKYDLDPNDAGFIELLRGKYANRAEFDLKVSHYVVGKLVPQKPANPADVVQSPARAGATEKSVETLTTEYQNEMLAAPRGRAGATVRAELKAKYQKQGVPVDQIYFT